jgi:hypothetical protein
MRSIDRALDLAILQQRLQIEADLRMLYHLEFRDAIARLQDAAQDTSLFLHCGGRCLPQLGQAADPTNIFADGKSGQRALVTKTLYRPEGVGAPVCSFSRVDRNGSGSGLISLDEAGSTPAPATNLSAWRNVGEVSAQAAEPTQTLPIGGMTPDSRRAGVPETWREPALNNSYVRRVMDRPHAGETPAALNPSNHKQP